MKTIKKTFKKAIIISVLLHSVFFLSPGYVFLEFILSHKTEEIKCKKSKITNITATCSTVSKK